jgi:hypothetical protein
MPEGVIEFLETSLPTPVSITEPSTVDDAIVAQGKLAYNINLILTQFAGLKVLEVILRIGQLNPVLHGMLATALEYIEGSERSIDIVSPTADGSYTDDQTIQFSCDTPGDVQPVTVTVSVPETGDDFQLDNLAPDYPESWMKNQQLSIDPFPSGDYISLDVYFSASYDDGATGTATVEISVEGSQSGGK